MKPPLPKMDWRRYWASYIGHGVQGTIAGALILAPLFWWPLGWVGTAAGLSLLLVYIAYQGLEFARRFDTPGRDMLHFAIGFYIGLGAGFGAGLWTRLTGCC